MDQLTRDIARIHARYAPLDERVAELLTNIRRACEGLDPKSYNRGNERLVEGFIEHLAAETGDRCYQVTRPPARPDDATGRQRADTRGDAPCVVVERQRLSNYDTWRGPGADDNTTGEEILKQYLRADLRAPRRPPDSVGEGRLYIPRGTLGADFLRILIPFGDYDSLNDLLEEAAHLHSIKYNNYLAGGTTDHVSFLEVNNGLVYRAWEALRRAGAWLARRPFTAPLRIPASALVAMVPGKASPVVFGGKIHTPRDVPERVYPEPMRDTLKILDYLFYRLEGGPRIGHPRELDAFHYARLYRSNGEFFLAFKDAVEPNRRNVNAIYRAEAELAGQRAVARVRELVDWGVETRLRDEVAEFCAAERRPWERVRIDELDVEAGGARLRFVRRLTPAQRMAKTYHRAVGQVQRVIRRWFFVTFFAMAYVLAQVFGWAFDLAFYLWPGFAVWFAQHGTPAMVALIVLEVGLLLYMMTRRIPTWIDNGYRQENRGDNLGSLRRVSLHGPHP